MLPRVEERMQLRPMSPLLQQYSVLDEGQLAWFESQTLENVIRRSRRLENVTRRMRSDCERNLLNQRLKWRLVRW